ncbi:predicted protein [Uncinocarpus reesii 1704]|uniref:Uncharacterized protein n=1 Tax=Uncinocarpus reesii (strain UAMH 1704) TaxID=336963 RepID=C4JM85_UNCRE|nr:uncharacterized protein UREG_03943 [Uncinocarpus reesii 1704]EEP79097.1 predicted protein [Uncinocarpus reesii 1704]
MAVGTMAAFGERDAMDDIMTSLKLHTVAQQEMPVRYESEEEEESESDLPGADDHLYSPVDSDMGALDVEHHNNHNSNHDARGSPAQTSNKDFTFRLPSPSPGPESPRSPAVKGRRESCLTLMAPKSPQQGKNEKQLRKSYGPYRDSPPFQNAKFFSSMILEAETRPLRHSICSEILSSDDELGQEAHFLIATSIVYRVPESKPSLISVGPASTPSTTPPIPEPEPEPEPQKKRPSPLNLAPSKPVAANPPRTSGSVKNRLTRLMSSSSKQEKRRGSYFMQFSNSSNLSVLETPSFSLPNWNSPEETWRRSGSESEQPPENRPLEASSRFSRRISTTSSRYSVQSQTSRSPSAQNKDEKSTLSLPRSGGFRNRLASPGQTHTESSPSQFPSSSAQVKATVPEPKKPSVQRLTPPPDRFQRPQSNSSSRTAPSYHLFPDIEQTPVGSSARSIKSVTSNSSKPNQSTHDTSSLRSLTQRYNRMPNRDDFPTQRRPSGSPLSMSSRADSRFRDGRHNSEFGLSLNRTRTLAVDEEKSLGSWKEDSHEEFEGSSPRKHKHSSSKSMKWFQGGNMSQAGKALNGLGSMIRTKKIT